MVGTQRLEGRSLPPQDATHVPESKPAPRHKGTAVLLRQCDGKLSYRSNTFASATKALVECEEQFTVSLRCAQSRVFGQSFIHYAFFDEPLQLSSKLCCCASSTRSDWLAGLD